MADLPYIHWELTSTGSAPDQNLATITITDVNGNVVETLTNQPLVGSTLWPGASLDPEDWPGWVKIGGIWYTDPSDAVLRQGVNVRADINPTAGPLFVAYPEATAACAQPEQVDAAQRGTTISASLPVTGTSSTGTLWMAAGFLGLGGLALAIARRRRTGLTVGLTADQRRTDARPSPASVRLGQELVDVDEHPGDLAGGDEALVVATPTR